MTCMTCEKDYTYDSVSKKCIKKLPGCIFNDKAQCVSCQANYQFNQGKCYIIGCKTYNQNNRCSECETNFKVSTLGFCTI